jgi:hypothetical protein
MGTVDMRRSTLASPDAARLNTALTAEQWCQAAQRRQTRQPVNRSVYVRCRMPLKRSHKPMESSNKKIGPP